MEIKVLGPGCPRCQQTEKIVKEAVAEAGVDAQIEKISDTMKIAGYGVFGTPAVVIDGEVKSVGKIPDKEEVKGWLNLKSIGYVFTRIICRPLGMFNVFEEILYLRICCKEK